MARKDDSKVLFVIAAFKLVKAALLIAVGIGLHHLARRDAAAVIAHWAHAVRIDPDNRFLHSVISHISGISERKLAAASVGTFIYAAVFLVEGIGLLTRRRWAEYLTVISTGLLLPVEVYELFHKPRIAKGVILLGNLLIVAYLIYRLRRTRRSAAEQASSSTG